MMFIEEKIIADCISGKRSAQRLLYNKYANVLFSICLRYAINKDEAEDILQEGFLKIFMNLKSYRNEGSFEGWMKKIIVNTAISTVRSNTRTFSLDTINEIPEENEEDSGEYIIHPSKLLEILNLLPVQLRIVFNLYAIEEYTHKEISEMLEVSESTSRTNLFRARKMLSKMVIKYKTEKRYNNAL